MSNAKSFIHDSCLTILLYIAPPQPLAVFSLQVEAVPPYLPVLTQSQKIITMPWGVTTSVKNCPCPTSLKNPGGRDYRAQVAYP
jgi:hypothetical protein